MSLVTNRLLHTHLREEEALVVENAIRLAIDSIINVLYGVNSARANEYQRMVGERDKEIQRLECRLEELEHESQVPRKQGCACRMLEKANAPDNDGPPTFERSECDPSRTDSEGTAVPQECELSVPMALFARPSSQSQESSLPLSPNRMGLDQSNTPHPSESSGVLEASRNLPTSPSSLHVKEEPCDMATVFIKWEMSEEGFGEHQESAGGPCPGKESPSEKLKTLVPVKYNQLQKYVKLDEVGGQYDFLQFDNKVIEKFCLPPGAKLIYKDATGTEVDAEIFSELVGQGNVSLTVFSDNEFSDLSLASEMPDLSYGSSSSTLKTDEVPSKRPRLVDKHDALSAKQLIEAILRSKSAGKKVLQEYQATKALTDNTRRQMVNMLVAHLIDNHGQLPTKATREAYALGIVTLFPSLKDPYAKKGYEHFYDATRGTGYISWRLKTVLRKIRRQSSTPPGSSMDTSPGGPNLQRAVSVERQLDGDACQEAMSLLSQTKDNSVIFQKMRETFQHRQKLVHDPDRGVDVLSTFSRFLDTKGLVNQDFTLLFGEDTSSMLLQKWDVFFRLNVIKEAKRLTLTPELLRLVQSAESPPGGDHNEARIYDQEMASLLLLIHLLPPSPGGPKFPKISASDALQRLIIFHKSFRGLEEHLRNRGGQQPYLLAVGRQKSKIDNFYVAVDKHLIPCQTNRSLGAFDELFKAHFVFNLSYDAPLANFYTFLQTTVYNIDVGKMKESPRVRDLRARLLNQPVPPL